MRLFRKKSNTQTTSEGTEPMSSPRVPLGVFSPAVQAAEPNLQHEFKRLAELEHIFIRSRRLRSLDDVPFVVNEIRNGNIVLLDITQLNDGREQSYLELKRIIERIRGETRGYQADIALLNDSCLVVTPSFVKF